MELFKVKKVTSRLLGELPLQADGSSFNPQSYKRETKVGETPTNTGYVETPTAAELKLKLNAVLDPQDFRNVTNDTLTIYLSNGSVHTMPNAWCTEPIELGQGEYDVTFNSATSEKLQ